MYSHYLPSLINRSEVIELGRSICRSIETHCKEDSYLSTNKNKIIATIGTIEAFQGRGRGNPLTTKQNELKEMRKQLISALEMGIESKCKQAIVDPEGAKSAEIIASVFNETPIKYNVSQLVIINQVNTRIRRLDTPVHRVHLKNCGVETVFDKLKEIEHSLEAISNEIDAMESTKLRGSVVTHVEELKSKISYILPYIESNCHDHPGEYGVPAKEITESISRIMTTARMRLGRKVTDTEDPLTEMKG